MTLQKFAPTTSENEIIAAILTDGAAIVSSLVEPCLAETVAAELREYFDRYGHKSRREFSGLHTSRCHCVLQEAPSSVSLVDHEMVTKVADAILLPHCESYQLGSVTGIELGPGQKAQELHRDDSMYPIRLPGMEMQIGVMWSLTDFTVDNGATVVVPGSHRLIGRGEPVDSSLCHQAVMGMGSALFYLGSTIHGAGANQTDELRAGLINTYSLGWLRQEVNQYLSVPIEVVRTYDNRMRRLLGYTTHDRAGDRLGKYYGNDTIFVDKDDYAKHYRPYQLDLIGE